MTRARLVWPLLLALVLQWLVPASLAWRSESILRNGARYYLRTAPVDPVDAFRGRYVALRFADVQVRLPGNAHWAPGSRVRVPLSVGADHFVRFGTPSLTPPAAGDFLDARLGTVEANGDATLVLPFDRYYLDERAAPAAEQAYRAANRADASSAAYVSIRVRDGHAVLEQLFIDNKPVQVFLGRSSSP